MKVLLINPPSNSPQPVMPLGLAYIAAALEKNNISVSVIDAWAEGLNYGKLEKKIIDIGEFDLIGITVMSPIYSNAMKTIRIVKKVLPKSKIVVGGTHPSSLPEECLQENPELDFAVIGEGDEVIVQLVNALENFNPRLSEIKGLVYRNNGFVKSNGRAEPIKNLDELPFPAIHLFPLFKYKTHPPYRLYNSYATLITSRGCPFSCTYCTKSVFGQNYKCQSSDRVIRDIEYLVKKFKIKQIHFYDDDFTINMKRIELICEKIIEKGFNIKWSCVTRVDLVNEALLYKMKKAGCWLIAYGVESGNQEILNKIKRGYRIEQIKSAFELTKKARMRTLGYFMAGLPGETYSTLDDTIKLSFELNPDFVSWSVTALYPGSEIYRQAVRGELGNNYTKLNTAVIEDDSNISSLSPYSHGFIYIYDGKIPRGYVLKAIDLAYKKFYFRASYIIRFLINLQTFTEFLSYLKTFIQYLNWKRRY